MKRVSLAIAAAFLDHVDDAGSGSPSADLSRGGDAHGDAVNKMHDGRAAGLLRSAQPFNRRRSRRADSHRRGAAVSGGVELYVQQAKLGLDLAVKDINAGGGVWPRRLLQSPLG